MAYPDDLPTCTDGSLGRAKVNTASYSANAASADASEYNTIKLSVAGLSAALGKPNGSTAGSVFEALVSALAGGGAVSADDRAAGKGLNPQVVTTNGALPASFYIVASGVLHLGLPQNLPSINGIVGIIDLIDGATLYPYGYVPGPATDAINGGTVGAPATFDPGVYAISLDGGTGVGVRPFSNVDVSALEAAIATAQSAADGAETHADTAQGIAEAHAYRHITGGADAIQSATNAQNGLATAAHVAAIEANATAVAALALGLAAAGYRAVSGNITIDSNDNYLAITANAAITLPVAAAGRAIVFKKATASLLTVTVVRAASESIENVAGTYTIAEFNSALYVSIAFYCDGTNWWVL